MSSTFDCIVIGAGFAGAVAARELAVRGGKRVLLLERRSHIGGNAYDCSNESGILVHHYGPHIFHTGDRRVFDYLSRFTQWRDYQHRVVANVYGQLMPVPFNLHSLGVAFDGEKAARLEKKLIEQYGQECKVSILELRKNTDPELSELADYVYEHIFLHYTTKQWGLTPEEIDPATTARVPVFVSRDDRYFQDRWQGMPTGGYTALFERMLSHPGIDIRLDTDALSLLSLEGGAVSFDGLPFSGPVIYTGAADELFSHCFGRLPYRTLDFQFETHPMEWYQTHGTVNYTVDQPYTRITEFKHLTGQVRRDSTTVVKEFSRPYTGARDEVPYYAILNAESSALYDKYRRLADAYPNLHLLGRLAEYQYYNMDAIVARALRLCDELTGSP